MGLQRRIICEGSSTNMAKAVDFRPPGRKFGGVMFLVVFIVTAKLPDILLVESIADNVAFSNASFAAQIAVVALDNVANVLVGAVGFAWRECGAMGVRTAELE